MLPLSHWIGLSNEYEIITQIFIIFRVDLTSQYQNQYVPYSVAVSFLHTLNHLLTQLPILSI